MEKSTSLVQQHDFPSLVILNEFSEFIIFFFNLFMILSQTSKLFQNNTTIYVPAKDIRPHICLTATQFVNSNSQHDF